MYSDLFLQQKNNTSIPKILLVALVAFVAIIGSQVFLWYSNTPLEASLIKLNRQLITNLSDNRTDIFFETSEIVKVYIIYGTEPNKLSLQAYDLNDSFGKANARRYHMININNLEAQTRYYYKIITEGKVITNNQNEPFEFETPDKTSSRLTARNPIYGKIITADGSGLAGSYVIVSPEGLVGNKSISVLSKPSGEWLASLPFNLSDSDVLQIDFFHDNYQPSRVRATLSKTSPIPQSVVIGSDYTFISDTTNVLPASTRRVVDEQTYSISVLYPQNNAIIPNRKPLFKGFGIPGTLVKVRVNSIPQYEGQTTINKQGIWSIETSRPFSPGKYVVMITLFDNMGQTRILSRNFVIAKEGEQVLGESIIASPSGSLTPSVSLVPSISSIPNISIIPTVAPTEAAVIVVTVAPSMPYMPTITPGEMQKAGVEAPIWWVIIGSLCVAFGVIFIRSGFSTFSD